MSDDKQQRWREVQREIKQPSAETYYIVHFHADGGNGGCYDGRRVFTDAAEAAQFAEAQRDEPGHNCLNSVRLETSTTDPGDEGMTSQQFTQACAAAEEKMRQKALADRTWYQKLADWLGIGWLV